MRTHNKERKTTMDKKYLQTIVLSALISLLTSLNTAWAGPAWERIQKVQEECGKKKQLACSVSPKCTWVKGASQPPCRAQAEVQNNNLIKKVGEQHTCFHAEGEDMCTRNNACFLVPTGENKGLCGWKGK